MRSVVAAIGVVVALAAGCAGGDDETLPQGDEAVELDPVDFRDAIDNPYLPFAVGSTWVYRETDAGGNEQRIEVTVLDETRTIAGIEATVVRDVVTEDGELVEDTRDWYVQDRDGNVWYLGEETKEYEDGEVVSTEGSWEAGVDGAQAGVVMPARPAVGMAYRQEHYEGEAEDAARIVSVDERVQVPFGRFRDVVLTEDFTPLEPDVLEYKLYARGVGLVLALGISGGSSREELIGYTKG